jgi:DNA polymerase (family 10)
MPRARAVAEAIASHLRAAAPDATIDVVGSLRRGVETIGDVDLLAAGTDAGVLDALTLHPQVERILGHGDTKASVIVQGGLQIDVRLVPLESRGAAQQYFTGSKDHNIALRDRATQRGFKLNEYGLFRLDDGSQVAGDAEDAIYAALGLVPIPAELRENRGEIDAAARHALPRLLERRDLQGDLHTHTTATDGRDSIEAMALAARAAGLRYLAITDHSKALAMANGLDEQRALAHAAAIRRVGERLDGITLLAGIECDIGVDGTLDLADDCLAQLDIVVASVHSRLTLEAAAMTDRVLTALECPYVDILGHPTGRQLLRREPSQMDIDAVLAAAARHGVALEINGQMHRLDLNDAHARLAHERGVALVIGSDSHAVSGFGALDWGVTVARRAWLDKAAVLNTLPLSALRRRLRRHRRARSV